MKKIAMIMAMGLMLAACSDDSEQAGAIAPEDALLVSAVTRSAGTVSDATEDHSPLQIFLMTGTDKTEGNFVYNEASGRWTSTIGVKEVTNYIFGFSPAFAAAGTIRPLVSGAADYSAGAVLTLDNLSAVGGDDVCVVVGVKRSGTSTPETPDFGTFLLEKQGGDNYVNLLLDHLYSGITFKIRIGERYKELRDIRLKKMELQSMKAVSQAVVTLKANADGTDPIESITYTPAEGSQSNVVYDYGTDANTTTGLLLTDSGTSFYSYCAPVTGIDGQLKLVCTYDVYNKKGTRVRENCTAENSLTGIKGLTIGRGIRSTVNLTVEPTYLYQLSDDELDNPGIKLKSQ